MLNRKISRNKLVAELANELGPEAALFHTWTIAHLDREGRVSGDPEVLKGTVAPRVKSITTKLIEKTLRRTHELGLVVWYEAEDDLWLSYPKFQENNKGLRVDREPESEIPTPPNCHQVDAKHPPKWRHVGGVREDKIREEKGREDKRKLRASRSGFSEDCDQVTQVYLEYFPDRQAQATSDKNRAKIKARLTKDKKTVEDLVQAVRGLCEDDWCRENGHDKLEIAIRDAAQVDRYVGKYRKQLGSEQEQEQLERITAEANEAGGNVFDAILSIGEKEKQNVYDAEYGLEHGGVRATTGDVQGLLPGRKKQPG